MQKCILNNWAKSEETKLLLALYRHKCYNNTCGGGNIVKAKNDLTGKKFGRLTVLGIDTERTQKRRLYFWCECECGTVKSIRGDGIQSGAVKSCGCLHKEVAAQNVQKNHTHKMSNTRIYHIWQGMKKRCYDIHSPCYYRYGGRGITVCDEWKNNFLAFYEWAIANGYSDDLTIDRIDNEKGYYPENCRWADNETQCRNRRTNIKITIGNATKTLTEWCEIFELDDKKIRARYNKHGFISIDELFNQLIPR